VKEVSAKKEITYKLIEIEKAESQVVAGINYRLCLKIGYHKADDDVDATETIRVAVYRSLQNQYSLRVGRKRTAPMAKRFRTARANWFSKGKPFLASWVRA